MAPTAPDLPVAERPTRPVPVPAFSRMRVTQAYADEPKFVEPTKSVWDRATVPGTRNVPSAARRTDQRIVAAREIAAPMTAARETTAPVVPSTSRRAIVLAFLAGIAVASIAAVWLRHDDGSSVVRAETSRP